jgi:hypothetical protein
LPVELLFEIHSAFDHLKRFHIDGEPESHCAEKAFSHLKRGLLDAFKLKLKYHNKDYNKLLRMKADLHLIDNGVFWPSLLSKRKAIVNLAKKARMNEGKENLEDAFGNWYNASDLIDQFESEYFESPNIQWARRLGFFHRFGKIIISIIVGIIAGVIGSAIVQYLSPSLFRFLEM